MMGGRQAGAHRPGQQGLQVPGRGLERRGQRGEGGGTDAEGREQGDPRETELCSECPASAACGHLPANETHSV